jgi:hypothetical protein
MRTTSPARSFTTALGLAALAVLAAGCGSDGPTEPEPTPTTTLNIDFGSIVVVEDCDGAEGLGDFQFEVRFGGPPAGSGDVVYSQTINVTAGGRTPDLGSRSYTIDARDGASANVSLTATELDRSVFGVEYADERLDGRFGAVTHVYSGGSWSNPGDRSITLGSAECEVRLEYTAS